MNDALLRLLTVAALNSARASKPTLRKVQQEGEIKMRTDERGTVTVAKWRGQYYLLDYTPAPEAGTGEKG